MTLDIKGGLKNTEMSSNQYVVIEELISNAIDSYLIRKNVEAEVPEFSASLTIDFYSSSLIEDAEYDISISCRDNGAGFGEAQVKAFVTKDSTYKDYLKIQGIGKCKGAGRIQYFHYFKNLKIDSFFLEDLNYKRRTLDVYSDTREISEANFTPSTNPEEKNETTVSLQGLHKELLNDPLNNKNLRNDFSARAIYNFLCTTFLQRFIILRNIVGSFTISITESDGTHIETIIINSEDLPSPTSIEEIPLICTHGRSSQALPILKVTRYSLPRGQFKDSQHEVALCANSAIVHSLTKYYFRRSQDRKTPIEDRFELLLIESGLLEEKVNIQRDGFNIPKECSSNNELIQDISMQDIVESLEEYVYSILTPKDFDRDALLASTQAKFGISQSMLEAVNIKIHYSDTEANIAKRVLKKYQEEIVNETSDIFDIKQKLLDLDPRTQDFRDKVNELSWKYTSTIKKWTWLTYLNS